MDKIYLDNLEMKKLQEKTGLSHLELLGLIAAINEIIEPKIARWKRREEDERMGRDIY